MKLEVKVRRNTVGGLLPQERPCKYSVYQTQHSGNKSRPELLLLSSSAICSCHPIQQPILACTGLFPVLVSKPDKVSHLLLRFIYSYFQKSGQCLQCDTLYLNDFCFRYRAETFIYIYVMI